jgi:UPF0755 protein
MVKYLKKKNGYLFGGIIIISSWIALVGLILFWPQQNPYSLAKVTVYSGMTLRSLSKQLYEKKIISNEQMFRWAVQIMGKEKEIPVGTFRVVNAQSNYKIIDQLVYGSPERKKVRVLEGWSMAQIANHLNEIMGFDSEDVIELANDHRMLRKHGIKGSSMEGYLFPDTYYFFEGDTPGSIVNHLANEFKKFWTDNRIARAKQLNMTKHEIVTLASIIEGEAIYDKERSIISGVYHNRLNIGMRLQADPTIQYIIEDGPRRLLNRDLKVKSPYNTYLHEGLPPGPINSPGEESLVAALYPEKNEYLFFVARGDGYHTFTSNEHDHNKEKRKFQKIRRNARKNKKKK